ncbi:MAG: OmpA family protein [Rhodobacteraceae bacterium]|nr:MAG: OmpA family protein [Paracoccaceae bacterium]
MTVQLPSRLLRRVGLAWSLGAVLTTGAAAQSEAEVNEIIRSLAPIAGQTLPAPPEPQPVQPPLTPLPGLPPAPGMIEIIIPGYIVILDPGYAIDMEVYFPFDSAELTPEARRSLGVLGRALESAQLRPYSYLVAGHTDAVGNAAYNQRLSERRAIAVRNYLIEAFAIDPDRLISVGFGQERLKQPEAPRAAVNRRVEIALIVRRIAR